MTDAKHEAPAEPCFECGSTERTGTACKPCNPEITDPNFGHEAPAEGAGEHDPIRSVRTIMARAVERKDQETLDHARIALDALRARSSAPEAREDYSSLIAARCVALPGKLIDCPVCLAVDNERDSQASENGVVAWSVRTSCGEGGFLIDAYPHNGQQLIKNGYSIQPLYTHPAAPSADHAELTRLAEAAGEEALGNLLAVIHGDGGHRALEVGTKQAALEAEKIVARLLSSAPEAREGEAVACPKCGMLSGDDWKQCGGSCPMPGSPHHTHPAAPSADKLREFGQHTNLELIYHYSEEGDSDGWQVHRVNGGVNDREWDLIGSGATPADAIDQALAALKAEGA